MSVIQNSTSRVLSPLLKWIPPNTPPSLYASTHAHFLSIPWTAALLSRPNVVPFIGAARNPASPAHDQFFGVTLSSSDQTLRHMLSFVETDADGDGAKVLHDPDTPVTKVTTLYEIGPGLSGYPGILHGGMTMSLMDESMGAIPELNVALSKRGAAFDNDSLTASVDIKFLRPIYTGKTVVATSWVERIERRKILIRCEVRDEEGEELARCSSTWVALRAKV